MVSPKLILLYTNTWKLIMKNGGPTGPDMVKFAQTVKILRDALTCSVCGELLTGTEIYSASAPSSKCDHFACKDCKGKYRDESHSCDACGDWSVYREDEFLELLVKGYKEFCRHFLQNQRCTKLLELKHEEDPDFDALALLSVIQEGSRQYEPELEEFYPDEEEIPSDEDTRVPLSLDEVQSSNENVGDSQVRFDKDEQSIDIKMEPIVQEDYQQIQFQHEIANLKDEIEDDVEEEEVEDGMEDDCENDIEDGFESEEAVVDQSYIQNEEQSYTLSLQDPLANNISLPDNITLPPENEMEDMEDEEEEVEDESEESELEGLEEPEFQEIKLEDIRTSSLRLASPPPPPLPVLTHAVQSSTSITTPRLSTPSIPSTHQIQINPRQLQSFVIARPSQAMSGQQIHTYQAGARYPIRFTALSLDGRPFTMVRQCLGPQTSATGGLRHATVTLPLNAADLAKKKIIVRPATMQSAASSATAAQLQKWSDPNKVLRYASGATFLPNGQQVFHLRQKVPVSTVTASTSPLPLNNSSSESRPQQVTRITLGTMTSAMSSGSSPGPSSSIPQGATVRPTTASTPPGKVVGTTVMRSENDGNDGPMKKLKVRLPAKTKTSPKLRRGCRCGNAATQPGKLTCCGQRCPCYVDGKSCIECRCKGCRNPHLPGGLKKLKGLNAIVDTKTNTTIPLTVSTASAASGSSSTLVSSVPVPAMNLVPVSAYGTNSGHQLFTRIHPGASQATTFSQLIPLANFAGLSIPISLISPATHAGTGITTTMRNQHGEPIQIQNIQNVQHITTDNNNPNVGSEPFE